jgi:hypothetical protein
MVRVGVWLIALALAAWLVLALLAERSGGEPSPSSSSTTDPEPTAPPPATTTTDARVPALRRELEATRAGRARDRRRFRARLRYVIHSSSVGYGWLERAFLCIHAGEGAWTAQTGNGYSGGLQMDSSFAASYAPWALRAFGPPAQWPQSVQVSTAIRAYVSGRGFRPWPNTARACGLLP